MTAATASWRISLKHDGVRQHTRIVICLGHCVYSSSMFMMRAIIGNSMKTTCMSKTNFLTLTLKLNIVEDIKRNSIYWIDLKIKTKKTSYSCDVCLHCIQIRLTPLQCECHKLFARCIAFQQTEMWMCFAQHFTELWSGAARHFVLHFQAQQFTCLASHAVRSNSKSFHICVYVYAHCNW